MTLRLQPMIIASGIFLLSISVHAGNWIDQRDKTVQADLQHMEQAMGALRNLKANINSLSGSESLPGVNKDAMLAPLIRLETFMQMILQPERKRLEIKKIEPRSNLFFEAIDYRSLNNVQH